MRSLLNQSKSVSVCSVACVWFILSALATTSCVSSNKASLEGRSKFREALNLWSNKPLSDETTAYFQASCESGVEGACILLGKKPPADRPSLAIIQGIGGETHVDLRISRVKGKKLHYIFVANQYRRAKPRIQKMKKVTPSKVVDMGTEPWQMDWLTLNDLEQGLTYQLAVLDEGGALVDFRYFRLFDSRSPHPRVIVTSCLDDSYVDEQKQIWSEVAEKKPQLLMLIGDNAYTDKGLGENGEATPEALWKRHLETRNLLKVFRLPELIPIISIWDDHDLGRNDSGKSYTYLKESKEIFLNFFPLESSGLLSRGPGLSSRFVFAGIQWVFLDGRSFRDPKDKEGQATEGEHLGQEQILWFKKWAIKERRPFFLVKGDQFFGGYHPFESFQGDHPASFKKFMKLLKPIKATPVLYLETDTSLRF